MPHSGTKSALARASGEFVPDSGTKFALAGASREFVPSAGFAGTARGTRDYTRSSITNALISANSRRCRSGVSATTSFHHHGIGGER